jgi:hypothetical protein
MAVALLGSISCCVLPDLALRVATFVTEHGVSLVAWSVVSRCYNALDGDRQAGRPPETTAFHGAVDHGDDLWLH